MAGCGYVCTQCEGKGFTEDGKECDYCIYKSESLKKEEAERDAWITNVHEGNCCSDPDDSKS